MDTVRLFVSLPIVVFLLFSVTHAEETLDPTEPIPGDLNLDGHVNFLDFIILSENFGKSGPIPVKEHPSIAKLEKLYGIWKLKIEVGSRESLFSLMFGALEKDEDDVPIIYGVNTSGLLAVGRYDGDLEKYVVIHSGRYSQAIYTFEIQDKSWVGDASRWTYGDTRIEYIGKIKSRTSRNGSGTVAEEILDALGTFKHYDPESIYIRPEG